MQGIVYHDNHVSISTAMMRNSEAIVCHNEASILTLTSTNYTAC